MRESRPGSARRSGRARRYPAALRSERARFVHSHKQRRDEQQSDDHRFSHDKTSHVIVSRLQEYMDPGSGSHKAPSIRKALIVNQIAAILPSEGFIVRLSGRSLADLVLLPAPSPNGWHCAGFVNPYSSGAAAALHASFIALRRTPVSTIHFAGPGSL